MSGAFEDVIAVDNAVGQFYVEVQDSDEYFKIGCEITPLEHWPAPAQPLTQVEAGTYLVGRDITPGVYAGLAGKEILGSCHWQRLSGVSGAFEDVIAVDNAVGQFYVEVHDSDEYFKIGCEITPLEHWPAPAQPLTQVGAGTYLVGRDIAPGTYRGEAGSDIMNSCHWQRLSGVSGAFEDVIAVDNAVGQFYVSVDVSDYALTTNCELALTDQ